MSDFARVTVGALAVAVLVNLSSANQQRIHVDSLQLTQELMLAAFPQLKDQGHDVTIGISDSFDHPWSSASRVDLTLLPRQQPGPVVQSLAKLVGRFIVTDGIFWSATFSGDYLSSQIRDDLIADAAAHPTWSDAEFAAQMKNRGCRFLPNSRESIEHEIDLTRFEGVLGRIMKSELSFVWRTNFNGVDQNQIFDPLWIVTSEHLDRNSRRVCYSLMFEPVNGRLTGIRGDLCHQ